jgi:hypothetical protein
VIIKPNPERPGIKLRDPKTMRHVPAEGIRVAEDDPVARHWYRQAAAGDAVIEPEPIDLLRAEVQALDQQVPALAAPKEG